MKSLQGFRRVLPGSVGFGVLWDLFVEYSEVIMDP